jgi:hypothetical protein
MRGRVMSDARLRELERRAAHDPDARPALLLERVRAGALTRERVEVADYCGDRVARDALGGGVRHAPASDFLPLANWVSGLSRWGPEVQVRAALAAAEVVHRQHVERFPCRDYVNRFGCDVLDAGGHPLTHGFCGDCDHLNAEQRRVLDACRAWLDCQCDEHAAAWLKAWFEAAWADAQWLPWVRHEGYPNYTGPVVVADQTPQVLAAAREAGEAPVREAIQRALISWALGEDARG